MENAILIENQDGGTMVMVVPGDAFSAAEEMAKAVNERWSNIAATPVVLVSAGSLDDVESELVESDWIEAAE